ncbi:MAG: SRPBCC family protein [Methanobacterium sp. ERen5]|nr:MAG: SRPBCC family protein [Methanobacterium sp. ERen5]
MAKTEIVIEPGKQEILIKHIADAPRGLVFKAFIDPEIYAKWIGPVDMKTEFKLFEPETGGSWRYIQRDEAGNEYGFHGVNHEVEPNERIIGTFEFEGLPEKGHVILESVKFVELDANKTEIQEQSVFQSVEDRDGMVASNMEEGVRESYIQLDELLKSMQD